MALTFAPGTFTLANWGFSLGDIATLAGAGRNVCTFLMTMHKDRTLFEFLQVDVDTVFTRKSLVDTTALHKRWDRRFSLLKNGRREIFTAANAASAIKMTQQMDRFTWLMILFTAALDASMQSSDLQEILCTFLQRLLEESQGYDFVRHEIDQHISGWRSASCVRAIAEQARHEWKTLGQRGLHHPGYIPKAEKSAVLDFLLWLMRGPNTDRLYTTSSTDILSLGLVLESLGVEIRISTDPNAHFEESQLGLVWTRDLPFSLNRGAGQARQRSGMRIPLNHVQEVASLHPRDRNEMRLIFEAGLSVVDKDRLSLRATMNAQHSLPYVKGSPWMKEDKDLSYDVVVGSVDSVPRLEEDPGRFAKWLFPTKSPALISALVDLVNDICSSSDGKHGLEMLAFQLENSSGPERFRKVNNSYDFGEAIDKIQLFTLGYWYGLLLPLIDTSRMKPSSSQTPGIHEGPDYPMDVLEAYGAWSWSDVECLRFIMDTIELRHFRRLKSGKQYELYRHQLLKLVAYLFGGAEISQLNSLKFGAVGIHGKLTTLYPSVLGGGRHLMGKFSLLEIDPTCIPSSSAGVVMSGFSSEATVRPPISTTTVSVDRFEISNFEGVTADTLTVHVEPDWDHDVQNCVVAYRHGGRLVHRLNPRQIDMTLRDVLMAEQGATDPDAADDQSTDGFPEMLDKALDLSIIPVTEFHGGIKVFPEDRMSNKDRTPPRVRVHTGVGQCHQVMEHTCVSELHLCRLGYGKTCQGRQISVGC